MAKPKTKTVKVISYDELKAFLKSLQAQNKIALLKSRLCYKTQMRITEFYMNGSMWRFECGEDESKVIEFYNKVEKEVN